MKLYCFIFALSIFAFCAQAQQNTPHVSGKVNISMADGLIHCDLTISQLPQLGKQYKILLNRGFNIGLLRNDTGKVVIVFNDDKLQNEAVAYLAANNNDTLKLPKSLRITYTGSFPVYRDTLNPFDFKGMIAFNGKTVRAAEQTKWYPVIYDVKNDKELLDVTYDITVECKDCKTIYLNGSEAKAGPIANFKAEKPYELLLFAGDYEKQGTGGSTFLNAGLTKEEAAVFDKNISSIKNFYNQYLGIPYDARITFLEHQAIQKYGPKQSWGFATFPTIAIAGQSLKSRVNLQTGMLKDTSTYSFYAHELGHYYYGHILQSNSTLRWFFLETMAEFLSLKASEAKYGKVFIQRDITDSKSYMADWKVKPLSQIVDPESIGESYRYYYAPLILLAMEKRFGEEKVREFCRQALHNTEEPTDYTYFLKLVKSTGIKDNDWKLFEDQVITQKDCKNIFNYL